MVKPVKRPSSGGSKKATARPAKRSYDNSRRQAQARETQAAIALAARDLFVERGYVATSMRDIADRAGVALQTIYNLYPGKPEIIKRIGDITVAGDDEPVAMADRAELRALGELTDPVELIERWVHTSLSILHRFEPLLPVLREAAAVEPSVADLWTANARVNRYEETKRSLVRRLHQLGALDDGLTVATATDIVWTILSFETYEALVVDRRWTRKQYATWAVKTLVTTLLTEGATVR